MTIQTSQIVFETVVRVSILVANPRTLELPQSQ
jgi:hypothetical protein